MTRDQWIVLLVCGFVAVATITALIVYALKDDDWSDWGREQERR